MIISFKPGRIRIRKNSLKNQKNMLKVTEELKKFPGLIGIETGKVSGSILLKYNPDAENAGFMEPVEVNSFIKKNMSSISTFFALPAKYETSKNKLFNRAMAVTFAACIISPLVKLKKLHIYSGVLFTGLTAKHMFDYKNRII